LLWLFERWLPEQAAADFARTAKQRRVDFAPASGAHELRTRMHADSARLMTMRSKGKVALLNPSQKCAHFLKSGDVRLFQISGF
jgi:hypothetical protein